uniref:UPAR/Ly6 domain-containing protein n=1 Tax=Sciurus vulgaris TaxID=55149 RepID=A0A8D2DDW1_SCIVU
MDKFLLLLLLLGPLPLVFLQAQALVCTVCRSFKEGHCLRGKDNCTANSVSSCRTRDFFFFSDRDGWLYDHTELDCAMFCLSSNLFYEQNKISSYCCKNQDFCNRYQGKLMIKNIY